jgi:hypothetical protein
MSIKHVTYFILASESGRVKIGQCCEVNPPVKRLKQLQIGCPEILEVLLLLPNRPPFEEQQMHKRFSQYRVQGEWFRYAGELKDFVERKRIDPRPTNDDDLRSITGCLPAARSQEHDHFDAGVPVGESQDVKSYKLYVQYCSTVGCAPAPYEKWIKLSHNPIEYVALNERVCDMRPPDRRKTLFGSMALSARMAYPYVRWESTWEHE